MDKPLALIIEDDIDLAEIFSKSLQGGGFATEIIRDGRTAIQRLAGTPPLVVVLDLHLPYVTGRSILQQIRADERLAETAVIVTTADAQLADDVRAQADLVLLKPVSVDQLRELAKRMLRRWQENKGKENKS
jgi:two-component system response regulator PrrA